MPKQLPPIKTGEEFQKLDSDLRAEFPSCLILYRGQTRVFDHIRSGRARPNARIRPEVEKGWSALASKMLGLPVNATHLGLVKAILQHYGHPTHFVDLTTDIEVAAWFATHEFNATQPAYMGNALRFYVEASYKPAIEPGYILVLAIPHAEDLVRAGRLHDLSSLPLDFARPHAQRGWLLFDRPPTLPQPDAFWVATAPVEPRASERFTTEDLFPPPSRDSAFAALLSLPFAQVPLAYFQSREDATSREQEMLFWTEKFCSARRLLSLPEYHHNDKDDAYAPRWNDVTLYEPHPFRMWRHWRFDLETVHPGVTGNVGESVKITLSPPAKALLDASENTPCAWPSLASDSILFTFAELDHDKAGMKELPKSAVWLRRDDDLVVETPLEAEGDTLCTMPGHAFLLRDGRVELQQTANGCSCPWPESHTKRVSSVLRLSSLIDRGELILLPHPMAGLSDIWYFVLTGEDRACVSEEIASAYRMVKALTARGRQDCFSPDAPAPPSDNS